MLFRIVKIPKCASKNIQAYPVEIVCTKCGYTTSSTTYKSDSILSMSVNKCTSCGENLNSQELLNKKVDARLEYHQS